jgi:hypothetical protein
MSEGTVIKGRVICSFFSGRSRFQTGLRCFAQGTMSAHSLARPSVSVGASHGPPGPYTVKGWEKVDPLLPGCGLTGFHSAVYKQVAPSQEFWEPSRVNWGNFHLRLPLHFPNSTPHPPSLLSNPNHHRAAQIIVHCASHSFIHSL